MWYEGRNAHYAVRATNANDTSWGAQTFWTVLDTDGNGQPEADYSWSPAYVWMLDSEMSDGIRAVDNGQLKMKNEKLTKGIYIVNGKKVLVK